MSKFTPGPWLVSDDIPPCVYAAGGEEEPCIAVTDAGEPWACVEDVQEAAANARLIAAAPDMYEVLTALLDALDANGSCQYERLREEGRAALAKATANEE